VQSPPPAIAHRHHAEDDPVRAPYDATWRLRRANLRSTGEDLATPAAERPGPSILIRPDLLLASGTRSTST
jgi:hypothetical protein